MDNPDLLVTLGIQDTGNRQTKTKNTQEKKRKKKEAKQSKTQQNTKKMSNTNHTKTGGKHRSSRRVSSSCFL